MGTRASIQFQLDDDVYFVYRGHGGYPDGDILPDIHKTLAEAKGRWSEPELECLVTLFLAMHYDFSKTRLPDYEITSCLHGDEEYYYLVAWNRETKEWQVSYE